MEKTLSSIGNYLDNTLSDPGRRVLDWLSSINPGIMLLLAAVLVAFFFAPMVRFYASKVYWKLAMWRSRVMGRRHMKYSSQSKIADAVVEAIESRVLSGDIDRE